MASDRTERHAADAAPERKLRRTRFSCLELDRRTARAVRRSGSGNRTPDRRTQWDDRGKPQETSDDDKLETNGRGGRRRGGCPVRGFCRFFASGAPDPQSAPLETRRRVQGCRGCERRNGRRLGRFGAVLGFKLNQNEFFLIPHSISTINPKGNPQHNPGKRKAKTNNSKYQFARNPNPSLTTKEKKLWQTPNFQNS